MKSTPFLIKPDKSGQALVRIEPKKKQFNENWLQELLQSHPNLLPVDEFEPMFAPIAPIGREVTTDVGRSIICSIVQINIQPAVEHTLSVEQIKSEAGSERRRALSEDVFWEILKQKSPSSIGPARRILEHFRNHSNVYLKMRRSSIVARMLLAETDQKLSLFYIDTDGALNFWVGINNQKLENAGIDRSLGVEYETKLCGFLTRKSGSLSINTAVDTVNVDAFIAVVDEFISRVMLAGAETQE